MDTIETWKGQIGAIRGLVERNLKIEGWLMVKFKNFENNDHFVKSAKN
jgi:hypothetical protein